MRYFLLIFFVTGLATVGILGFRGSHTRRPPLELFPDMVRQNRVRPETPSEFFPDRMSTRLIPAGTVPHDGPYLANGEVLKVDGKPVYAYEDSPVNTGRVPGTTNFVPVNPMPITHQLMERGQQRYQINCMPCHGPDGDGKGITSKYGMVGMANFHDKRLIDMADGEIFNTITYGKNLMGSYGANVEVEDRWAIIAYVRALERSQLATADDVPEPERAPFKK
ncbi:MAG TPA: cytochrome c [Verrucomicrobiae bacterium]|jgi:mono/diheme cytochrome c family protein|nr:cytochrome c [Verrucomicrobiae bacterium]